MDEVRDTPVFAIKTNERQATVYNMKRMNQDVKPGMVETEMGKIIVSGQSWQKVHKTPSGQNIWVWWYTSVIPATWQV
jgi:hypothetical protein